MNILAVSVDYFPKLGGISLMTHHLCNALGSMHDVRLLAPSDAEIPESYSDVSYELVVDEDSNPRIREGQDFHGEMARIVKLVSQLHVDKQIDRILLFHPFYYGPPLQQFARANGIPASCYIHGFELRSQLIKPPNWRETLFFRKRSLGLRATTIDLVRNIDEILVNSSVTGQIVREAGRAKYHITGCGVSTADITDHWIDASSKDVCGWQLKKKLGFPADAFLICFVGRVVPSKNVPYLIRVLEQCPDDVHLAICGNGNTAELEEQIKVSRVGSRVRVLGEISETSKWDYLGSADVLALPSIILPGGQIEGFGIVMLEATLRGAAVVVSQHGGMQDFVLDRNGFYIDTEKPESCARLIAELKSAPQVRLEAVARAQKLLLEKLTWQKIGDRITSNWQRSDIR